MAKKKKKKASRAPSKSASRNSHKHAKKGVSMVSLSTLKAALGKKGGKKKKTGYRNPGGFPRTIFGYTKPVEIAGMIGGLLAGVTAVKLLPPMFPPDWQSTQGRRFALTLGTAVLTAVGAMMLPSPYRDAIILGAGAQTASVGLNIAVPKVSSTVSLGRLRDFVAAGFPVPQNPIMERMYRAAIAEAPAAVSSPAPNMGRYKGRWG